MLSNQILHKTAQDIREITGFDCAIWDMQGLCLVRTNENLTEYELQIQDFRDDEEERSPPFSHSAQMYGPMRSSVTIPGFL